MAVCEYPCARGAMSVIVACPSDIASLEDECARNEMDYMGELSLHALSVMTNGSCLLVELIRTKERL